MPVVSIRSLEFGDFWRDVALRFVQPVREAKLRAVVADVTLGAPDRYDQFPADQAGWDVAVDRLTMWLHDVFAHQFSGHRVAGRTDAHTHNLSTRRRSPRRRG